MSNIYVASSWRNQYQQEAVARLRKLGHDVYDFRNPREGQNGFHWSEIDPKWLQWTPSEFRCALQHSLSQDGFRSDMTALCDSAITVLVLPCGRSAHLELGIAVGRNQTTYILALDNTEPELMYLACTGLLTSWEELETVMGRHKEGDPMVCQNSAAKKG